LKTFTKGQSAECEKNPQDRKDIFRLAAIIDSSDDAIILLDRHCYIESWNAGAEKLYGYTAAEVVGRNAALLVPSDKENELLKNVERIQRGERIAPYDTIRMHKSGKSIYVSLSLSPVRDSQGRITGASAIARDISERKRMETRLEGSERFAHAILDSLTAHIAVLDENGQIIAVNKAWRDFAAANSAVMDNVCEGADYLAVCNAAEGKERLEGRTFYDGIRAVMEGRQKVFTLEYPCHSPEEKRWFAGRVTRFAGSESVRIVVAHENITERKLAEDDLKHYREHLEELIKARTAELEEKNAQLVRQVAQLERAEKAIRESEERFRTLVDLAPDIIYRLNDDGTIDFISTAVRQLGYDPEDLIGVSFENLLHPDDRPGMRHIVVEKRIGERRTRNIEVRLLNKAHEDRTYTLNYVFIELSARGLWNVPDDEINRSDKQFLYTLGVAHDITAQKLLERELREKEKGLALLKNVASAANAAATVDDALRVAVEGIACHIGWPVGHVYVRDDELPGVMKPTDIWYLEDEERFRSFVELTARTVFFSGQGMIGAVWQSRKPMCVEDLAGNPNFLRKAFDEHLPVRGAFGFPVMVNGEVNAILEFFSPRSEKPEPRLMALMAEIGEELGIVLHRKKTEETLKKLSRAIEQSPATVVITDMRGRIQYVNPVFSTLTGYVPEEVVGKTPRIVKSGFHSKSFYQELWETIRSGRQWNGKICNRKKNGEIYWEQTSISPVRNEHGEITHFVAVKEDITKLLEYEEELKRAKESSENANRAKSDFLASMSHELRTPLNAIIGFSEVIKEQYFGPLTEKQEEYVTDILNSGKHLLDLINDILDLSKIEAGKMVLDLSPVPIAALVRSGLTMVREKAIKHGISLDLEIEPALETFQISADERKLKQVLFNLLSNAVKFTPDGGAVRLAVRRRNGGDGANGAVADLLEISVSDTGIGVAPADQEKIFEPFYQVSQGQTNKPPGTGLGLPVSRELIELHGGILRVQSRGKNQGSTFLLTIPIDGAEIPEKTIGEA
jgi:PAS domain S-box-containing protein